MEFSGLDKLTLVDYPGNMACILFFKGCNFRCPWCHNASLVEPNKSVDEIPFNEIMEYLNKRKGVLDGVVISGGEPTLMNDLKEKIIEIKKLGLLVKLDTNGSNPSVLKDLVDNKLVDYVAMDIKNSFARYGETVGVPNIKLEKIKESINYLLEGHCTYEFRTTLIDEYFNEESIDQMGQSIKGARVLYLQKFVDSGDCINANGLHAVPKEKALVYKSILSKYVNFVTLRGYE